MITARAQHPALFASFQADTSAGYDGPAIPGLALDITFVAALTARMVLRTAMKLAGHPGEPPEDDHLLWTNRGGWIFDRPLQLTVERHPRDPSCTECGPSNPPSAGVRDRLRQAIIRRSMDWQNGAYVEDILA